MLSFLSTIDWRIAWEKRVKMSFQLTYDAIAKRIDHSLLGPTFGHAELEDGCRLAARYGVASVCIKVRGSRLERPWAFRTVVI